MACEKLARPLKPWKNPAPTFPRWLESILMGSWIICPGLARDAEEKRRVRAVRKMWRWGVDIARLAEVTRLEKGRGGVYMYIYIYIYIYHFC
jgi:hypothetical protein